MKSSVSLNEKGFTITELLVSMTLSSTILLGALFQYVQTAKESRDSQVRIATFLQAQAVVQNLGFELRVLGNGLPFDQANFQIGENTISDPSVTFPFNINTSSSSRVDFRLNETGDVFLLTQDFNPTSQNTIHLTDISSLDLNDPIFISNSVVGGDDGFYGKISGIDTTLNSVTITDKVFSPASIFKTGSLLEEVPMVSYESDSSFSQITRNSGFGPVVIAENATLELEYLDFSGNPVTLPLTGEKIINQLRSIQLTVEVSSDQPLSDGDIHTARVIQRFGLRNLNYLF